MVIGYQQAVTGSVLIVAIFLERNEQLRKKVSNICKDCPVKDKYRRGVKRDSCSYTKIQRVRQRPAV